MPIKNTNFVNDILKKANVHRTYMHKGKLIVCVTKKLPLADLKNQDVVPRYLPNGTRTDVIEAKTAEYKFNKKHRPLVGGISCCNSVFGSATLGAIVRDSTDGQIVGLTNNHAGGVLYDISYETPSYGNTALSHIHMLQPSPNDGGTIADDIGPPKRAVATQFGSSGTNYIDATIIDLSIGITRTDILKMGRGPFSFILDKTEYPPGTTVYKIGRTTGLTIGEIVATDVNVILNPGTADEAWYYDQIMIESDTPFISGGDSGSALLMKSQGIYKIIGLMYGGSSDDLIGMANHIHYVSSLLQIEAWNGNIVLDAYYPYVMVGGRCYKHIGQTLNVLTHEKQRTYTNCVACQGDAYPNKKIHMVT